MRNIGLEIVAKATIVRAYTSLAGSAWVPLGTASATLTSNNTNVSNNDTVTIGNKTYTFKTALTPTEGQVLIGASADASLLNLIRAINHTGTPDTDYKCAAAHTQVAAKAAVSSTHGVAIVALDWAATGSDLATTEAAATLSWEATTMIGGPIECAQLAVRNDTGVNLDFGYCGVGDTEPANGVYFTLPTAQAFTFKGLKDTRQLLCRQTDSSATAVLVNAIAEAQA